MDYLDYVKVQNATWELLIQYNIKELPIPLFDLCQMMDIHVRSLQEMEPLSTSLLELGAGSGINGFSCFVAGQAFILYNADDMPCKRLFSIAHELGHLVLGHAFLGQRIEPRPAPQFRKADGSMEERMANFFARQLLAPDCVMMAVGTDYIAEIMDRCRISAEEAERVQERLFSLNMRRVLFQKSFRHGCILYDERELLVLKQFQPYIDATMIL